MPRGTREVFMQDGVSAALCSRCHNGLTGTKHKGEGMNKGFAEGSGPRMGRNLDLAQAGQIILVKRRRRGVGTSRLGHGTVRRPHAPQQESEEGLLIIHGSQCLSQTTAGTRRLPGG